MIRVGSLFAGIGGFDLGFERAGMKTIWQVENNKWCNQILSHHWPNAKRYEDVEEFGPNEAAEVDLICGGFPCQDISVAGNREGLSGERSGLWWEFHRVLQEARPTWVVIENVPGLLSSNGGRDMGAVVGGLADIGYRWAYRVLDSQWFGVAQRRRRVFIVGHLGDGRAANVLFESASGSWDPPSRKETGEGVADPLTKSFAKHHGKSGGKDSLPRNHILAYQCQGTNVGEMGTLPAGNGNLTGGVPFICFEPGNIRRRCGAEPNSEICSTPGAHKTGDTFPHIAMGVSENQRAECRLTPYSRQLTSGGGKPGQGYPAVLWLHSRRDGVRLQDDVSQIVGVRRLTPLECEKLQGFPNMWTGVLEDHAKNLDQDQIEFWRFHYQQAYDRDLSDDEIRMIVSDTQRYKALGNAVTVNVAEWIGQRIVKAHNT